MGVDLSKLYGLWQPRPRDTTEQFMNFLRNILDYTWTVFMNISWTVHKRAHELFKECPWTLNGSWLIHEHHLLEWFMNSSCHKDTTFTWTAHELFMWMWCLCDLNYSWTIPANSVHKLIMNCLGPFNVHGYFLNSSWSLLWTVIDIFIICFFKCAWIFLEQLMKMWHWMIHERIIKCLKNT